MTTQTDAPPCDCHGEPMYWGRDPRLEAGGTWRCRVKNREAQRRWRRKKGHAPRGSDEHLEKMRHVNQGEDNGNWVGDDAAYGTAHTRHRKALSGRPCAEADETCSGRIEVALKKDGVDPGRVKVDELGRPYTTETKDYRTLCVSHHRRYDS